MTAEESFGALSCDAGSGRLGETLQHAEVGDKAAILLGVVSAIPPIIVAIFGQCGTHGCPDLVDRCPQQPAIATAGEAMIPTNRDSATSLDRRFMTNAACILKHQ